MQLISYGYLISGPEKDTVKYQTLNSLIDGTNFAPFKIITERPAFAEGLTRLPDSRLDNYNNAVNGIIIYMSSTIECTNKTDATVNITISPLEGFTTGVFDSDIAESGQFSIPAAMTCMTSLPSSTRAAWKFSLNNKYSQSSNSFDLTNISSRNTNVFVSFTSPEMQTFDNHPSFPVKDATGNPLLLMAIDGVNNECSNTVTQPAICRHFNNSSTQNLQFVGKDIRLAGTGTGFITASITCP